MEEKLNEVTDQEWKVIQMAVCNATHMVVIVEKNK